MSTGTVLVVKLVALGALVALVAVTYWLFALEVARWIGGRADTYRREDDDDDV